jgi:hypothetical protein
MSRDASAISAPAMRLGALDNDLSRPADPKPLALASAVFCIFIHEFNKYEPFQ